MSACSCAVNLVAWSSSSFDLHWLGSGASDFCSRREQRSVSFRLGMATVSFGPLDDFHVADDKGVVERNRTEAWSCSLLSSMSLIQPRSHCCPSGFSGQLVNNSRPRASSSRPRRCWSAEQSATRRCRCRSSAAQAVPGLRLPSEVGDFRARRNQPSQALNINATSFTTTPARRPSVRPTGLGLIQMFAKHGSGRESSVGRIKTKCSVVEIEQGEMRSPRPRQSAGVAKKNGTSLPSPALRRLNGCRSMPVATGRPVRQGRGRIAGSAS